MQQTTISKLFLILIFVVGILSLAGVFLTAKVNSQNSEPTETPTPYWMAYPPQKRAYFETQEAGRIEALKSPEPPPPPTFAPETEEPIILDG